MPKIKYDVRGVESGGGPRLPVGVYKGKLTKIVVETPEGMDKRMVVTVKATGAKNAKYMPLNDYINLESEAAAWKVRQFLEATGKVDGKKGESGTLDTDTLVGTEVMFRVREDTYNGEYSPKVGAWLKSTGEASEDDEPDDDDEPDTDADDGEGEGDEESYSDWDDDDLIAELEERELDVPMTGRGSKKKLNRDKAIELLEETDEDDEDDGDDEEGEDYSEWELADLKAELKERGLKSTGPKAALIKRLEEDDENNDDDDEL